MTNEKSVDEGNGEFHEDVGGAHGTPKRISIPPKLRKNVVWDERVATLRAAVRRKAAEIAEKSLLLDVGEPADATDDESYIRRTNSLLAATNFSARQRCPVDLEKAIKKDGALNPHAELVVFGEWLLVPNAPGLNRRGRRQFVQRLILRTLAVALAELRRRRRRAVAAGPGAETPKKPITATDLAKRWAMLFSDPVEPTDFDARLPTLRRLLPAFLGHLRSGACQHAVKTIRRAPEIEAVYRAITLSSRKVTTSPPPPAQSSLAPTAGDTRPATPPAQTPQPATLTPLHLELIYSAPAQEQEYRGRPPGSLPPSTINYLPTPVAASSPARSVRRDRQGKIALVPQLPIREHFKVRALIDRLVILVSITALSTGSTLKALLKAEANTTCFAQDRTTVWSKERDWRKQLPKLCLSKKTGQHFATMIQDPTSEKLAKVPKVIDDRFGIDGPVALFLIELSVDLYPEPHHAPDEQILLREQMVGLLQRHHWGSTELLQGRRPQQPRHADARQVYDKPNGDAEKRDPRYIFQIESASSSQTSSSTNRR